MISSHNTDGEYDPLTMGQRCVGYHFKLEDSIKAVANNESDIHEDSFNFAVVESCSEGVYAYNDPNEQYWFEWKRETKICKLRTTRRI